MEAVKHALLFGATGLVGTELLKKLCQDQRYSQITLISRRAHPFQHPKIVQLETTLDHLDEAAPLPQKVDDCFCALGSTIKKAGSQDAFRKIDHDYIVSSARYALKNGAKSFHLVSSVGANAKSPIFYSRIKGITEESIQKLKLPYFFIYRPSFLVGDRQEKRFGEHAAIRLFQWLNPILVGPLSRIKPTHADHLAQFMVKQANSQNQKSVKIYESWEME
jgi:uncharacterized protein YbjT (DUF2867 family)